MNYSGDKSILEDFSFPVVLLPIGYVSSSTSSCSYQYGLNIKYSADIPVLPLELEAKNPS
jgi:hypothetical protein